ncbi:MAG: YabP/YqfC family sporulation protein [Oscillospiraceae bacterium]|nr:YabP/YqfC family sporulation protein [Oscillospiraceae bacterium]
MPKKLKSAVNGWVYLDTYLHLHGNRRLRVENCRRILEYNEVLVRLQTFDMTVEIWGTGLRVFDYSDSSVIVTGKISSVNLTEKS